MAKARVKGAVVGEYGKGYAVCCKDFDETAQDISTYTGITIKSRSPDAKRTFSSTGSFLTDGSDGWVSWSFDSDNYPDRPGDWDEQVWLSKSATLTKSYPFILEVEESI